MVGVKRYKQYCPVAHALDLVGDRWALLVVRELMLGPRRYTDLAEALPGIGTNVLATRLRTLETAGVVQKTKLPPPAAVSVYELTDDGRALDDVLHSLARWGAGRSPRRTRRTAGVSTRFTPISAPTRLPTASTRFASRTERGLAPCPRRGARHREGQRTDADARRRDRPGNAARADLWLTHRARRARGRSCTAPRRHAGRSPASRRDVRPGGTDAAAAA